MKRIITYYRNELLLTLVSGAGVAAFLFFVIDITHYFKGREYYGVIITIILSLLPFLLDIVKLVLFNRKYGILEAINQLNLKMKQIESSKNKFLIKSATYRIKRETETLNDLLDSSITLPALQNYEYIREVHRRVIEEIMESGDHYFTLSNLEFWMKEPFDHIIFKDFVDRNIHAANKKNIYIHRIIIVRKTCLPINKFENLDKDQLAFKGLVDQFYNTELHSQTAESKIKTFFYFTEFEEDLSEPVPFTLVVSANLLDIMLIKPKGLNEIAKRHSNPSIEINFHTLNLQSKQKITNPILMLEKISSTASDDSRALKLELHLLADRIKEKLSLVDQFYDRTGKKIPNRTKNGLKDINDVLDLFK